MAINGGFFLSFGVLFVDILEEFNSTRAETATIQSVQAAVVLCSEFFIGFVVDRYEPRVCGSAGVFVFAIAIATCYFAKSITFLVVTCGVVAGVSNCFFILSGMKIIARTFEGSTQLVALALLVTSSSIGGIPYPYFLRYLSDNYGLIWTFLITGCLMALSGFLALIWVVPKQSTAMSKNEISEVTNGCTTQDVCQKTEPSAVQERKTQIECQLTDGCHLKNSKDLKDYNGNKMHGTKQQKGSTAAKEEWKNILKKLFNNVSFILFAAGQALTHSSLRLLVVFVIDVLKEKGLSANETTISLMVLNFCGIPGRLLPGLVKKVPRGSSFICVILMTILASPAIFGLNFVHSFTLAIMICCLCGLALGTVHACNAIIILRLVGETLYTPAVGLTFGLTGIIVAVTGPLSGLIRDSSSSYLISLSVISAAVLTGSTLFCFSFMLKKRKEKTWSPKSCAEHLVRKTTVFIVATRL